MQASGCAMRERRPRTAVQQRGHQVGMPGALAAGDSIHTFEHSFEMACLEPVSDHGRCDAGIEQLGSAHETVLPGSESGYDVICDGHSVNMPSTVRRFNPLAFL